MNRFFVLAVIASAIVACLSGSVTGAEIHVPADHPTIQAAINAAADGDVVVVSPGKYPEHVSFLEKAITVRSTDPDDPAVVGATIIDVSEGPCVIFADREGPDSVLAGFTLSNLDGISRGEAADTSRAIVCSMASPTIVRNTIAGSFGAGIRCSHSSALIANNTIIACSGEQAISLSLSSPVIVSNIITGNDGTGIWCGRCSSPLIASNVIAGNGGSGITCCGPNLTVIFDCILWSNACGKGPQILAAPIDYQPTRLTLAHTLIQGGKAGVRVDESVTQIWGPGNIDADPQFVDPGRWDDAGTPDDTSDDIFVLGDYHLLPGSSCIDAGTNDVDNPDTDPIEELPETDIAGLPRIMDGDLDGVATVDMGAYEYLPGDTNYDGKVNILDLIFIRNNFGVDPASIPTARQADANADGAIDMLDLIAARNQMGGR